MNEGIVFDRQSSSHWATMLHSVAHLNLGQSWLEFGPHSPGSTEAASPLRLGGILPQNPCVVGAMPAHMHASCVRGDDDKPTQRKPVKPSLICHPISPAQDLPTAQVARGCSRFQHSCTWLEWQGRAGQGRRKRGPTRGPKKRTQIMTVLFSGNFFCRLLVIRHRRRTAVCDPMK